MDAAALVDLVEIRLDSCAHFETQFLGGSGKRRRLADDDRIGRNADFAVNARRGYERQGARHAAENCQKRHVETPPNDLLSTL